jgi:hypothetical protein
MTQSQRLERYKMYEGATYGILKIVKVVIRDDRVIACCKCKCGASSFPRLYEVINKNRSCGCLRDAGRSRVHGSSNTRLYRIYNAMKDRCRNKNNSNYHIYGGRGISVCAEWLKSFIVFKLWAVSNGYDDRLQIDRINTNGDYNPSNCRWVTCSQNLRNTRRNIILEFNGKRLCLTDWSKETGLGHECMRQRFKKGWSAERILTTPSQRLAQTSNGEKRVKEYFLSDCK